MNQFLEAAAIALQAIWANKLRSFLTVLGNIVAVTSIIAVVSLVQGMNEYVTNAIVSDVGADNFTIQRVPVIRTQADEDRVRSNPRITLREASAIRRFSENIGALSAEASASATMSYHGEAVDGAQVQSGQSGLLVQFPHGAGEDRLARQAGARRGCPRPVAFELGPGVSTV